MAAYTWPTGRDHTPASMTMGWDVQALTNVSPLNAAAQRVEVPGRRWHAVLQMPEQRRAARLALHGYLGKVGGDNLVTLHDMSAPTPRGTCNLTGVTASAAAAFATSLTLNGCGASTTLLAGDKFSVALTAGGTQLVMVTDDATASGGGVMAVTIRAMLRGAVSAAAAVVLNAPTTTWRLVDPNISTRWRPGTAGGPIADPLTIELIEDFS